MTKETDNWENSIFSWRPQDTIESSKKCFCVIVIGLWNYAFQWALFNVIEERFYLTFSNCSNEEIRYLITFPSAMVHPGFVKIRWISHFWTVEISGSVLCMLQASVETQMLQLSTTQPGCVTLQTLWDRGIYTIMKHIRKDGENYFI